MAAPTCSTLGVSDMGFSVATFKGKCLSTGGLSTKLYFGYDGVPWLHYQRTPKWDVPYDGWEKSFVQSNLNYTTRHNMFCIVENVDGSWVGGNYVFWLPRPEDPKVGSPFLVLHSSGVFDNGTYSFVAITDVGCHLEAFVGTHKPYINEEINVSGGVSWRHKPGLVFNWHYKIEQSETGDTLAHTFIIPYAHLNVTYWFVLMGTVDGYPSPSISPFFKFRRLSLPVLDHVPAFSITLDSAYIGGKLKDDRGAGVYLQLRYTKVEDYTDYLDKVGPYRSMWQHTSKLENLLQGTKYKFSIIGSHDKDMIRYGYSEPGYFTTLFIPSDAVCYVSIPKWMYINQDWWDWTSVKETPNSTVYTQQAGNVQIYVRNVANKFTITRYGWSYQTNVIPPDAVIISAFFRVYVHQVYNTGSPWHIVIQSGGQTYPHVAATPSDYDESHYGGNAIGQDLNQDISIAWHDIYLNAWGLSLIQKDTYTNYFARVSSDVYNHEPSLDTQEGLRLSRGPMYVTYYVP